MSRSEPERHGRAFIETSNLGLRKGSRWSSRSPSTSGAVTKLHRRTAVVAHVSRGGTGLLMEAYNARTAAAAGTG